MKEALPECHAIAWLPGERSNRSACRGQKMFPEGVTFEMDLKDAMSLLQAGEKGEKELQAETARGKRAIV